MSTGDNSPVETSSRIVRLRKTKPCPVCASRSVQKYHPFCSARCSQVDLNRWLTGAYAIPGESVNSDAELLRDPENSDR